MRRPSHFKKTDVIRATKAVRAAGLEVTRVEINKDGAIAVFSGKPIDLSNPKAEPNEWDSTA